MASKNCSTCKHYLGGGCCNLGSEKECAENTFELWTPTVDKDGQ